MTNIRANYIDILRKIANMVKINKEAILSDSDTQQNTSAQKPREIPLPVRLSFEALETIKQNGVIDETLLTTLKKALPVLAMKLSQNGEDVSAEILKDHAQKGPEHIKTLCESFNRAAPPAPKLTYEQANREKTRRALLDALADENTYSTDRVYAAAAVGTARDITKAIKRNIEIQGTGTFRMNMPYFINDAARWGNINGLKFLLRKERKLFGRKRKSFKKIIDAAASSGQNNILDFLLLKSKKNISLDSALIGAAENGHVETVEKILGKHKFTTKTVARAYEKALENSQAGVLRRLAPLLPEKTLKNLKADSSLCPLNEETLKIMMESPTLPVAERNTLVSGVIAHRNFNMALKIIDCRDCIGVTLYEILVHAINHERADIISHLIKKHALTLEDVNKAFKKNNGAIERIEMADILINAGIDVKHGHKISLGYERHKENLALWRKMHDYAPKGLGEKDPHFFNKTEFNAIAALLHHSGEDLASSMQSRNDSAYRAVTLFQTADRLLQYFQKFGEKDDDLSTTIDKITFPAGGTPDFKNWGNAILRHGPKMAKLFQYADKLPSPERTADGKDWSLAATGKKVAPYIYPGGEKHPELAALFHELGLHSSTFNQAARCVNKFQKLMAANDNAPKPGALIPGIRVSGDRFGMEGYSFFKLPSGDPRGLFLGKLVDCCQSINGAGDASARHGFLKPDGGFYVVANDNSGEIVGETWAWRGKKGEVVFDSLETLGNRIKKKDWIAICKEAAKEFAENNADVTALNIGAEGGTPYSFYNKGICLKLARPLKRLGYSDAKNHQFNIWKRSPE